MEAETFTPLERQLLPMEPHRLQQVEGATDVAVDEGTGPINRAIHVALCRQVHHQISVGLVHGLRSGGRIHQIHTYQRMAGMLANAAQITGVAKLVEVEDLNIATTQ